MKEILLGDTKYFNLDTGTRYTKEQLLTIPSGDIPVISARLDIPFGKISSKNFIVSRTKIVLWNIDSSRWDTRVLNKKFKFIPTDHCGYIEILDKNIVPEYIAYKLYEYGLASGFKHEYRASLKNIRPIPIMIPTLDNGNFDVKKQKEIAIRYYNCLISKVKLLEIAKDLSQKRIIINTSSSFEKVKVDDILEFQRGNSEYTQRYCIENSGPYPVYSAGTKDNITVGSIKTYDHEKECLRITKNGYYAGSVDYIPFSKFSLNGDVGILCYKEGINHLLLDYRYLEYALQNAREEYGFNWNNKPTEDDIRNIELELPIKNGVWNIEEQKRISRIYQEYKNYLSKLNNCVCDLNKLFVKIDDGS